MDRRCEQVLEMKDQVREGRSFMLATTAHTETDSLSRKLIETPEIPALSKCQVRYAKFILLFSKRQEPQPRNWGHAQLNRSTQD